MQNPMHSHAPSRLRTVRERAMGDSSAGRKVTKFKRLAVAVGVVAPCAAAEDYPELSGAAIVTSLDTDRATSLPGHTEHQRAVRVLHILHISVGTAQMICVQSPGAN